MECPHCSLLQFSSLTQISWIWANLLYFSWERPLRKTPGETLSLDLVHPVWLQYQACDSILAFALLFSIWPGHWQPFSVVCELAAHTNGLGSRRETMVCRQPWAVCCLPGEVIQSRANTRHDAALRHGDESWFSRLWSRYIHHETHHSSVPLSDPPYQVSQCRGKKR